MSLADIYAPLPDEEARYSWDDATALVLDSFRSFDEEFYALAKQMIEENRIDAPVEPRKRGGAFCSSSTPGVAPYVMLNFLGRTRDISTMAHELGHAIHAMLSSSQPLTTYHAILPLCETASVFCEMILNDYLKQTQPELVTGILMHQLEDLFATSHRQNMFSQFEMATHQQISTGVMSAEALCECYKSGLQDMFADSVRIPDEFCWEWASIPHIYDVPFYVYSYNFGNLLVIALYQHYQEAGAVFIPQLKQLLSAGSSQSPVALTAKMGCDITSPSFWEKSLTYIDGLVTQLEAIT